MNKTISIIMPLHNAQAALSSRVLMLLEVVGEIAASFEIVLVDDGSTDLTEEVAFELSMQYPQVLVARHATQRGMNDSIATGVAATFGETILVISPQASFTAGSIRQMLLADATKCDVLEVMPTASQQSRLLDRLSRWGLEVEKQHSPALAGLEMFTRKQYQQHQNAPAPKAPQPARIDHGVAGEATKVSQPNFVARLRNLVRGD